MFVFLFIQLLSGYLLFVRISKELVEERVYSTKGMTKFGTAYLVWITFCIFLGQNIGKWFPILILMPVILLKLSQTFIKKRRATLFRRKFVRFLSNIIVDMRLGIGFRTAVCQSSKKEELEFRKIVDRFMESIVFSTQKEVQYSDSFLREVVEEFRQIDIQPHNSIHRLQNFRNLLREQDQFRRKSGQVVRQIQLQSIVLIGFYIALLIYVMSSGDISDFSHLILISASLFIAGTYLTFFIGRNVKWKM